MNESGWYQDPYGRHEARWFSQGQPTESVRDGQVDSWDPPPGFSPPPVMGSSRPTGRAVLAACWPMLRANPRMVLLAIVGGLLSLAAGAILFLPTWSAFGGSVNGAHSAKLYVSLAVAGFGSAFVSIFVQTALTIAANAFADGRSMSVSEALRETRRMSGRVAAWALFGTLVGTVVRALERRLGWLGLLVGLLGGLLWSIATYFVIPVMVAEGLGPIDAVRRSSQVVKQRWGLGLRTTLRLGAIQLIVLVPLIAVFAGVVMIAAGGATVAIGWFVVVLGAVAVYTISSVFFAMSTYARTMIYRYAVGQPVPGIPAADFAGVFQPRRRRDR